MAVQALTQIGVERVVRRPDLVELLRVLNMTPDLAPDLREALSTLMSRVDERLKMK
jgi:hypothetical protein